MGKLKKQYIEMVEVMYNSDKNSRKLLGSQIEDELMNYILETPVEIGSKIPNEYELAMLFEVSRSTIREAVKTLVSKGILEVRRGSGTFVVSTSTVEEDPLGISKLEDKYKLALELCDVRLMLEPEIAAMAAEYATEDDIRELKSICAEVEELYETGRNHISKDIEFHTYIAGCSRNRVVKLLIPVIDKAVMTFANLTHRQLKEETIETHRAVTEAVAAHDPVGARCAMIMHLTYNRNAIVKMLHERQKKTKD